MEEDINEVFKDHKGYSLEDFAEGESMTFNKEDIVRLLEDVYLSGKRAGINTGY